MTINLIKKRKNIEKLCHFIPSKKLREKILKKYDTNFLLSDLNYHYIANFNELLKENDKCLIIAISEADEFIGCGGILSKHKEKFDCLLLDNENNKTNEFNTVMNKLNIMNYCLSNIYNNDINDNSMNQFDIKKYDYIFIPYEYDFENQQCVKNKLIKEIINRATYKENLKIVYYELFATILDFNYLENISDYICSKTELINSYRIMNEYNYAKRILGLNYYRALVAFSNFEYAEVFKVININEYLKNDEYDFLNSIIWWIPSKKLREKLRKKFIYK